MPSLRDYLFGPKLNRIYEHGWEEDYRMTRTERVASCLRVFVNLILFCGVFMSVTALIVVWDEGESALYDYYWIFGVGCSGIFTVCLMLFVLLRIIGRSRNKDYRRFISLLNESKLRYSKENRLKLTRYDFDFGSWPVDYESKHLGKLPQTGFMEKFRRETADERGCMSKFKTFLKLVLTSFIMNTVGYHIIYPGQLCLNSFMIYAILQGRQIMIESGGLRAKIRTDNGIDIDTMFMDRRTSCNCTRHFRGNILLISCEGNAGFYEVGRMWTAFDAGFSVLGWNRPGYWGSKGSPSPLNEKYAIDSVIQYAIHVIGFDSKDIAIYAWSIGCFPASFAAQTYPDLKFVVLDAGFDEFLPIAESHLPSPIHCLKSLVPLAVRQYIDLNVSSQLCEYSGIVFVIRRLMDEKMSTGEYFELRSNRSNDLLIKLLKARYPKVVDTETEEVVRDYLSISTALGRKAFLELNGICEVVYDTVVLQSFISIDEGNRELVSQATKFPLLEEIRSPRERKKLALFLVRKYMLDFDASHEEPLSGAFLSAIPWINRSVIPAVACANGVTATANLAPAAQTNERSSTNASSEQSNCFMK